MHKVSLQEQKNTHVVMCGVFDMKTKKCRIYMWKVAPCRLFTDSSLQLCLWADGSRKHGCGSRCLFTVIMWCDFILKTLICPLPRCMAGQNVNQHKTTTFMGLCNSLGRCFWLSVVSLSETALHSVHSRRNGNNQWGQSYDFTTSREIWSLTHSLRDRCSPRAVPAVQPTKQITNIDNILKICKLISC